MPQHSTDNAFQQVIKWVPASSLPSMIRALVYHRPKTAIPSQH